MPGFCCASTTVVVRAIGRHAVCSDSTWPPLGAVAAIATAGGYARGWGFGPIRVTPGDGVLLARLAGATPWLAVWPSGYRPFFCAALALTAAACITVKYAWARS